MDDLLRLPGKWHNNYYKLDYYRLYYYLEGAIYVDLKDSHFEDQGQSSSEYESDEGQQGGQLDLAIVLDITPSMD